MSKQDEAETSIQDLPHCGVVRPIANIDGYPSGHWGEVHQIIVEAAESAGYKARLVSDDEALGVILGRIVRNLHDDPITVIDVSGLNPNVMFELGMRLAFDKPVVVIKDDKTPYPFDASPIQYLPYPSDMRHVPLMAFKEQLSIGIKNTATASSRPNHRSFLQHFGSYTPGELGESSAISANIIMDELFAIRALVSQRPAVPKDRTASSAFGAFIVPGKSHDVISVHIDPPSTQKGLIDLQNFLAVNPNVLRFQESIINGKPQIEIAVAQSAGEKALKEIFDAENRYR